MPTFSHLYLQIEEDKKNMESGSTLRQAYDSVLNKLSKFVDTPEEEGQYAFMSEETKNVDFLNLDKMAFNIQGVDKSIKAAYNWFIIDTLWKKMFRNRENISDKSEDKAI